MRELVAVLTAVIAAAVALPALAAAPDGLVLTVSRGSGAAVTLRWNGTIPTYTVFRSTTPATVTDPANKLGNTSGNLWFDTPPAGSVFFYAVVGNCPSGQLACGGHCDLDTDADTFCDSLDNCPARANTDQANRDGDAAGDVCDYCVSDPQKVDRGRCGCFKFENTGDDDGDGAINCHDQCPGSNDALDADRGGLPDACDPCSTGLCSLTLPDRFYAELPGHEALRVSRDGRWIAAREYNTLRGVLIPTEDLIRNPSDTSSYEYLGDERINDIRGFSDDDNLVLANIETYVPQAVSKISAAAIYDRTNGTWTVLGLYDDTINIDSCRFYSNAADMTSDGKVVYGRTATVENPCKYVGFRYDSTSDEWQLFGGPEGKVRLVEGVSGDGGRIVGSEDKAVGGETGVMWTYQPPNVYTPQWLGEFGVARDVTFDGSVVAVTSGQRACRWTATGGLAQLGPGTLNADYGVETVAISDGGNLIAGYHVDMLASLLPFMWTQGVGFGNLYDYLIYRGFTPSQLGHFSNNFLPSDLSGDGRIIVGRTGAFPGRPVGSRSRETSAT